MRIALLLTVLAFIVMPKAQASPINNSTELAPEVQVQPKQENETDRLIQAPVEEVQKPVEPEKVIPVKGCEQYRQLISQYDWDVEVAMKIMKAESTCGSERVNNNPNTGDYSVGLFQINLYGANARTRPSEIELKDPATNIAWANKLYQGNGKSFIGQWGVCRTKVSCY